MQSKSKQKKLRPQSACKWLGPVMDQLLAFERKYGVKITDVEGIERKVGLPAKAQKAILDKGKGAFFSSGSRPGQTPQSWAYGRLASVILKKGAYKYDKHILDKYNVKLKKPLDKKSLDSLFYLHVYDLALIASEKREVRKLLKIKKGFFG